MSRRPPLLVTLLTALLLVWEPLTFALVASSALSRFTFYGLPAYALLLYRAIVVGLGIAAGIALRGHATGALRLGQWWAVSHAAALVLTFSTPYFPSNRVPGTKGATLVALLAFDAGWWLWLRRSRRLAEIYGS